MSTSAAAKARKPAARTRAAAKQASRAALITSALDLFASKGLDVSLDEVCARAGYTRGAFYVHFKNRDELLAAAMEQVGRGSLDAALGDAGRVDLGAVMRRFGEGLASGEHPVSRRGKVRPFQLLDACARSPEIRERYVALVDEGVGRIAEVLAAHQKSGAVRPDVDPRGVATLLEAMVIGMEILHDVEAPLDLEGCAAALLQMLAAPRPR